MATPKPKAPLINFDDMLGIEPKQDTVPAPVQGGTGASQSPADAGPRGTRRREPDT